MSSLLLSLLLPVVLAHLPVAAHGQDDEPPLPVFSEEVSVQWISVPTVLGSHWPAEAPPEAGLFQLEVDGDAVRIEAFDAWDAPVGVVFLQDLSGSMAIGGKLDLGRRILEELSALVGDEDAMAVVTFAGGRVDLQVPFTANGDARRGAAESWSGYGTTAVRDALAALPEIARAADRPRRAVVLVTDGIDNASVVSVDEVRALLAGQGLPLYVVDVDADAVERPSLEQGRDEGLTLGDLAEASGGRRIQVTSPVQVAAAARVIARDLRRQMVLSFTADSAGVSTLRTIEVSLRGETSGLVHRSRYYGPPPGHTLSPIRKEKP
ncbi:MAG TPA: VWA domain-containing protein [Thermoanaerobaculia bacterium]|nr:VWA domain-containing protein [Thermoanaerobaculia bacterium]